MRMLRGAPGGRRRPRSQSGAAAVEFALVVPIFVLLVVGIIDFGFAFNAQISLTQAVREGVRLGAVGVAPSETAMEDRLDQAYAGVVGGQPVVETVIACDPASLDYTAETATLAATLPFSAPITSLNLTLRSEAVMRCGG
jgi:Flp pilus assembly protein TadG